MTLKTKTATPLDRYSLAEWRTELCGLLGIAYSGQETAWQTMFDSIVAETEDFLLKRSAGQPWGEREDSTDTVDAGGDTTYPFPDDLREIIWIREENSTQVRLGIITTKGEYGRSGKDYGTQHPWESSSRPYWFFDGHNDATPAAQQWRRIGAGNSGATIRIYYIPYFNLSTPELPASERSAARTYALMKLKLLSGDTEEYLALRQDREDEIAATDKLGRKTASGSIQQVVDDEFGSILG